MKVQIDIDGDLWSKFKAKVHHEGKTLGSVVPAIMTPVLEMYINGTPEIVPHAPHKNTCDKCGREITGIEWLRGDGMVKLCNDCMTVTEPTEEQKQAIQESANRGFQIVHPPTEKAYTEAAETFKEIAKPLPQPTPPTTTIDWFHHDFVTGFKETGWWDNHRKIHRHHLDKPDGVPKDVNLLDVLEHIADCVMAGMARSGSVYELKLSDELLQAAFRNTIELLKSQVIVTPPTNQKEKSR